MRSGCCFSQIQNGSIQYKQTTSIEIINNQKDSTSIKFNRKTPSITTDKLIYTLNFTFLNLLFLQTKFY
jgi:hypothetical protein